MGENMKDIGKMIINIDMDGKWSDKAEYEGKYEGGKVHIGGCSSFKIVIYNDNNNY